MNKITKEKVFEMIVESAKDLIEFENVSISKKTPLYGDDGILDSLGLVSLVVSLESRLCDNGINVTIVNDNAGQDGEVEHDGTVDAVGNRVNIGDDSANDIYFGYFGVNLANIPAGADISSAFFNVYPF